MYIWIYTYMYIEHVYLSLLDPTSVSSTLWGGRVWDKGRLTFLTFGNVLAGFLILDDSYRGARKMIFFCHLCKRLGAEAEGSVCKHSCFTHAPPPSGGAFGALLCRKEFLLHCSSHSPPNHWAALRPRPWGATVMLLPLSTGTAVPVAGQGLVPKSKDYCRHLTWWLSNFLSL